MIGVDSKPTNHVVYGELIVLAGELTVHYIEMWKMDALDILLKTLTAVCQQFI